MEHLLKKDAPTATGIIAQAATAAFDGRLYDND
jgi:hypothetical protein